MYRERRPHLEVSPMLARIVSVAAAVAVACVAVPTIVAYAKEDPAKAAAARDALKKEYKAAKKYITADFTYYVDSTKLKYTWDFKDVAPPADPDQGLMMEASMSPMASDTTQSVNMVIQKCAQKNDTKHVEYTNQFKAWGKTVKMADVENLIMGFYQEFMLTCTDPIKDRSHPPMKRDVGPAKLWACAVGTDKEEKKRVRKDWFVWPLNDKGAWTWFASSTMAEKLIADPKDEKNWAEKVDDLMKNVVPLTDARAGK
jgi:hypothetical protein